MHASVIDFLPGAQAKHVPACVCLCAYMSCIWKESERWDRWMDGYSWYEGDRRDIGVVGDFFFVFRNGGKEGGERERDGG